MLLKGEQDKQTSDQWVSHREFYFIMSHISSCTQNYCSLNKNKLQLERVTMTHSAQTIVMTSPKHKSLPLLLFLIHKHTQKDTHMQTSHMKQPYIPANDLCRAGNIPTNSHQKVYTDENTLSCNTLNF